LSSRVKDYLTLFGIAGLVVGLDQWTKWLVRENIAFGDQWLPGWLNWLSPYARFVYWHNSGAAFGMFQNGSLIFTILAFVVIAAIIYYFPQVDKSDWSLRLAMGLQLGGAAGNLVDRLTIGTVTDFISIGAFPVFNVADSSITIGVIALLIGVWINDRKEKLEKAARANTDKTLVDSSTQFTEDGATQANKSQL